MRDRGWAASVLSWEWRGVQLVAEISRCRYFVRGERCEAIAWCELRDVSGGRRVEIGSFRDVAAAKAACERDAAARCRRDDDERLAIDVRIARGRRRRSTAASASVRKADKGRELPAGNYRPAAAGELPDLDAALAAFAGAIEEEG